MIDQIGGRKVLATLVVLAVAVGAVIFKGDVPAGLQHVLEVIFGAFVLGNGVEHVTRAYAGNDSAPVSTETQAIRTPAVVDAAPTVVDMAPITAAISETHLQVAALANAVATTQEGISFLVQYVGGQIQAASQQAARNRQVID